MIAKTVAAALTVILGLGLCVMAAPIILVALLFKLWRWVELQAAFAGDEHARAKAEWRAQ